MRSTGKRGGVIMRRRRSGEQKTEEGGRGKYEALRERRSAVRKADCTWIRANGPEKGTHPAVLQGDPSGRLKPPVDLVPTDLAAGWPLL